MRSAKRKCVLFFKVLCIQLKARFIDIFNGISCIKICIHGNNCCQTGINVYKSCILHFRSYFDDIFSNFRG